MCWQVHVERPQMACHLTHTTAATHAMIEANLHETPKYGGWVDSKGPRYCPSIEDKVVRFKDKDSHQVRETAPVIPQLLPACQPLTARPVQRANAPTHGEDFLLIGIMFCFLAASLFVCWDSEGLSLCKSLVCSKTTPGSMPWAVLADARHGTSHALCDALTLYEGKLRTSQASALVCRSFWSLRGGTPQSCTCRASPPACQSASSWRFCTHCQVCFTTCHCLQPPQHACTLHTNPPTSALALRMLPGSLSASCLPLAGAASQCPCRTLHLVCALAP